MAHLTGTVSSLAWGDKRNGSHEASTKVLNCSFFLFFFLLWVHNKTCKSHNTVQEILVIHRLWIKTTHARTNPCRFLLEVADQGARTKFTLEGFRVKSLEQNLSQVSTSVTLLVLASKTHLRLKHRQLMLWNQRSSGYQDKTKPNSVSEESTFAECCAIPDLDNQFIQIYCLFFLFYFFLPPSKCMNEHGQRIFFNLKFR